MRVNFQAFLDKIQNIINIKLTYWTTGIYVLLSQNEKNYKGIITYNYTPQLQDKYLELQYSQL